jgi:hypothetical protein
MTDHRRPLFVGSIDRVDPAEDLGAESEITDTDKRIAPRFWAQYATPLLKRLLNALPERKSRVQSRIQAAHAAYQHGDYPTIDAALKAYGLDHD